MAGNFFYCNFVLSYKYLLIILTFFSSRQASLLLFFLLKNYESRRT